MSLTGVILAGGLGTRLRDVLPGKAKSVVMVQGRPFLALLMEHLRTGGISRFVLCTGHLAEQVRSSLGVEFAGAPVVYSEEHSPLGTGGAVHNAFQNVDAPAPWMVTNGDSFLEVDLNAMAEHHRQSGMDATIAVVHVPDGSRFGAVEWNSNGYITAFQEKTGRPEPKWINGGVYLFNRNFLNLLPDRQPLSLEKDIFPEWLGRIAAFPCKGRFIDIGTPDSYQLAQSFFQAENV